MMRVIGRWLSNGVAVATLQVSAPAFATSLSFDCDVPPDHFSSISDQVTEGAAIRATVQMVEMRPGKNLPVAGARLIGNDGAVAAGIQLVAASARAKQFDIVFNARQGEAVQRTSLGQVDVAGPIPFELTVSDAGTVTVLVGDSRFDVAAPPVAYEKGMVFCSTGQFKFSDIRFADPVAAAK